MADRFRTPRKEKQWGFVPGFNVDMAAFGTFLVARIAFTSKQTVLRMLGEYVITTRPTVANADRAVIAVGIGKVSSDAFGVGATAMPDPSGEPEYPWLYWASHAIASTSTDAANSSQVNGLSVRRSFDIRTMRKFSPNESLVVVVEAVDVAGSMPTDISFGAVRVLLTVH